MNEFQPVGVLTEARGDKDFMVTSISAVENCEPLDLVFVDKKEYLDVVRKRQPSVVVTSEGLKGLFDQFENIVVLVAPNVPLAHALIKQKYGARDYKQTGWSGVHPSATIHESARLDSTVVVEPRVVIGKNVIVGKNTRIMAGSIVENDVTIGDDTTIHPLAVVGYGCVVGGGVTIGSGSVIGSEGFGFAQDGKRKSHGIPQTGIVVMEDRVRIGSNCTIDRAAYQITRIGAGTKIDNLCHIAHNVEIGQDCLLTSMFCIAGSSKIGNRVVTSGMTGILDHVKVGDDVVLLHRAGVSNDIETPGAYAGAPLQPLRQYMRNAAVLKQAEELKKRILALEKSLNIKGTSP